MSAANISPAAAAFSPADRRAIAERSLFLEERLSGARAGDPAEAGSAGRLEAWRACAAAGDEELFRKRLEWLSLDADGARAIAGAVRLPPDASLPVWIDFLDRALARPPAASQPYRRESEPLAFEELLTPLVDLASEIVRGRAGAATARVSDAAYAELERALLRSLSGICGHALDLEFQVFRSRKQIEEPYSVVWPGARSRRRYDEFTAAMREGGMAAFFREYPVLARFASGVSGSWTESTAEFLARLESDTAELAEQLGVSGEVVEIRPGLSDRHHGGRTSTWVRFASGATLIYKPKNLETEAFYYRLLEWLNQNGSPLPWRIARVLNRGTHGWVEEVPHLACQTREEVERYYLRAGMLLSLLYVLQGSDCHSENLIACGEHPVLIDMECLMQHRVRGEEQPNAAAAASEAFYWDSVFRTALLPRWEFGTAGESYDISGLGAGGGQNTSFRTMVWEDVNTDSMRMRMEAIRTEAGRNVVYFQGAPLEARQYAEAIAEGFANLYRLFLDRRDALVAPGGPLAGIGLLRVRSIYRHTKIYMVVLNSLFHPKYLRDGMDASIRVEVLARPLLQFGMGPEFRWLLEEEERSLLCGDIPVFEAPASSDALRAGGYEIPHFFREPVTELVARAFRDLGERDLELQTAYIRASLASARREQAAPAILTGWRESAADTSGMAAELEAEAVCIAEETCAAAVHPDAGSASWITMAYFPEAQRWQLEPMAPRFYDGISGTALFLAAAARALSSRRCRDLALAALRGLARQVHDASWQRWLLEKGIGAGMGAASVVYGFVRCAGFLEEPGLLEDAARIASVITPAQIAADSRLDLLSGAAGAILGLLPLHQATGDTAALAAARACGERLLETQSGGAWRTLDGKPLTGFSHGAAGIAYALLRLYAATAESGFRDAAETAYAYERGLFDETAGNWPNLQYPKGPDGFVFSCSWCHGAPGIALGRMGGLDMLDNSGVRLDIERGLKKTSELLTGDLDHLCCGNLGRIDVLLTAGLRLSSAYHHDLALRAAALVLKRARQKGQFSIGWDRGPYLASFQQGIAGIGYELLRLARPDAHPCVLLWE